MRHGQMYGTMQVCLGRCKDDVLWPGMQEATPFGRVDMCAVLCRQSYVYHGGFGITPAAGSVMHAFAGL
jgi:hypothetical protein